MSPQQHDFKVAGPQTDSSRGTSSACRVQWNVRSSALLVLLLFSLPPAGCETLQKKHENPVMVAAPRRVEKGTIRESGDDSSSTVQVAQQTPEPEEDGTNVQQVVAEQAFKNSWDTWVDDTAIFNSQVAATVNGAPVLNGDVLDPWADYMIGFRKELQKMAADPKAVAELRRQGFPDPTPELYETRRYQIIKQNLPAHVQKKLLVERLKSGLKAEQVKMMNNHIDQQFEKRIQELKAELKVSNKTELILALHKKGTTLENVKDNFALDRLSTECIALKSEKPDPIERPDLVAYYQAHPDKFLITCQVKWEQIQVSFEPPSDKKAARKKMDQAIAELNRGVPFAKVAEKYSDGLTAKTGGQWDWMEAGNLADTKLEKKLFDMPVGQLSEIHEGPTAFSIVRVVERQEAGRKPFKEVQAEIRGIMEQEQNQLRVKKLFKELFSEAVIESVYELPSFVPED